MQKTTIKTNKNCINRIEPLVECRLQRLLPLKRALTEVEHDIHDAHNAMEQVYTQYHFLAISWN